MSDTNFIEDVPMDTLIKTLIDAEKADNDTPSWVRMACLRAARKLTELTKGKATSSTSDLANVGSEPSRYEIDRIAKLLMATWYRVDPKSDVTVFPTSFVANFADMARTVIADNAKANAKAAAKEAAPLPWMRNEADAVNAETPFGVIRIKGFEDGSFRYDLQAMSFAGHGETLAGAKAAAEEEYARRIIPTFDGLMPAVRAIAHFADKSIRDGQEYGYVVPVRLMKALLEAAGNKGATALWSKNDLSGLSSSEAETRIMRLEAAIERQIRIDETPVDFGGANSEDRYEIYADGALDRAKRLRTALENKSAGNAAPEAALASSSEGLSSRANDGAIQH